MENLFLRAINAQREFAIDDFYTNIKDEINMAYYYAFDQQRREKNYESIKSLQDAPSSGSPDSQVFYSQLIKRYSRQGRGKLLQFHKESRLPRLLENISLDSIREEIPPLMALGYILSKLSEWRPPKGDSPRNPSECNSKFNIFDDGKKPDPYGEPVGGSGMNFPVF